MWKRLWRVLQPRRMCRRRMWRESRTGGQTRRPNQRALRSRLHPDLLVASLFDLPADACLPLVSDDRYTLDLPNFYNVLSNRLCRDKRLPTVAMGSTDVFVHARLLQEDLR